MSPKMVSVSEDYLVFLHDELAENQSRLREILGDSQASAILSWSADRLVTTVEAGRHSFSPIESVLEKLTGWGFTASQRDRGKFIEVEVKCPYAERIHPKLVSKEPRCPLGEYILGAVRLDESKSQLVHNSLTEDGVKLTIQRSEYDQHEGQK